jgi:hypothetical protein
MTVGTNQRRDQRAAASIPVVLLRGRTETPLVTCDVSYRGVFVEAFAADDVRALVKLRVELPAGGFTVHAMIVRVVHGAEDGRAGMGLQFWALSGAERTAWEEFVRGMLHAKRAAVQVVTPTAPFSVDSVGPDSAVSGIRRLDDAASAPAPATSLPQRARR